MKEIAEAKMRDVEMRVRLDGVGAMIGDLEAKSESVRNRYKAGDMPFEEARDLLFRPIVVAQAARAAGWSFGLPRRSLLSFTSTARYEAMLADRERWLSGKALAPPGEDPWLFKWGHARNISPGFFLEDWCEGPASPEDCASFFSLMEAAFVPAEYYAVPPEGMPTSAHDFADEDGDADGEGWRADHILCSMDATELLVTDDPIGMRFDLPLRDGGVAHVVVGSAEPVQGVPVGDPDWTSVYWDCSGWVEGYTAPVARPMTFTGHYGEVHFISLDSGDEQIRQADCEAYRSHPLWAPYRTWVAEHRNAITAALDIAVRGFLE